MALIEYRNVDINQQEKEILKDINLSLGRGEFAYLVGEVGSGKSTLLKSIYGEVDILGGEAMVLGANMRNIRRKEIPALRRRMGIVFQDFQLLIDRDVKSNLDFVLKATGWKQPGERARRIEEVLQLVNLPTKGYKLPGELSGGEQQRVVIARAILNKPELILADEPTGNLDVETGRQIVKLLHSICEQGSTVLMVTHQEQWLKEFPGTVFRCHAKHIERVSQVQHSEAEPQEQESE